MIQTTMVKEIQTGDVFVGHWEAVSDARYSPTSTTVVDVIYVDGGRGVREWVDSEHVIEVQR